MRNFLITAAVAAALIVMATSATAKPINVFGGCVNSSPVPAVGTSSSFGYFQSFKTTFSTLKAVSVALWGPDPSTPLASAVTFRATVSSGTPGNLAVLEATTSVLPVGLEKTDAQRGFTLTFIFPDGLAVAPGTTYSFLLEQVDHEEIRTNVCLSYASYADGAWYSGLTEQTGYDLEFKVTGSGSGRAR
jgi:hypothetical protein